MEDMEEELEAEARYVDGKRDRAIRDAERAVLEAADMVEATGGLVKSQGVSFYGDWSDALKRLDTVVRALRDARASGGLNRGGR